MSKKYAAALAAALLIFLAFLFAELSSLKKGRVAPLRILDRNGILLREVRSSRYGTAYPVKLDNIPAYVVSAAVISEDKRFYSHCGVDFLAVGRAILQNIKKKRTVSGGSTITQQLIRNVYNYPRTLPFKMIEALRAVCVEIRYPKKTILEEYFNRIPYGNGAFGIEAASKLYFNKTCAELTLAESALLTAIPAATRIYNPYSGFAAAKKRQERILSAVQKAGKISREQYERAIKEKLVIFPPGKNFFAPHFCDYIIEKYGRDARGDLRTTLDYDTQKNVEFTVKNNVMMLKGLNVTNASVIVIDNKTSELIAMAGSADYFDWDNDGQVNGAVSLRQPGSACKPFVYGLALEDGATAADILPDIESHLKIQGSGYYIPRNYDQKYHGPVRVRTALACSYNVATVNLAYKFGAGRILEKFRQCGFLSLKKDARHYGMSIALGSGEVTLFELARAYAGMAAGGRLRSLRVLKDEPVQELGAMFSGEVSAILTSILSDNQARDPAFGDTSPLNLPFKCAAKTGTSKDFKDNWAAGYTSEYTVAVWAGNFDGKPMKGVSGISGAAPIFRYVMMQVQKNSSVLNGSLPAGIEKEKICAKSGKVPGRFCGEILEELFIIGSKPSEKCPVHRAVILDARNGLPAGKYCPEEFAETRVYEVYSGEYYEWAKQAGIESPPAGAVFVQDKSPLKEPETFGIIYPMDGDVYKIDSVLRPEFQVITLKPRLGRRVDFVEWDIDGKKYKVDEYPYYLPWMIEKGEHKISFMAGSAGVKEEYFCSSISIKVF